MNSILRFKGKPSSAPAALLTFFALAGIALLVAYALQNNVVQNIRWPW